MQITKEWISELCNKYGKRPREVRDVLWPNTPTKSLAYLNKVKNIGVVMLEQIADTIGCSVDELLRRPMPSSHFVAGDNNQVGNINITNDPQSLHQIIAAQKQIIDHQDAEIKRLEQNTKEQLHVKDQQIADLGKRLDRMIELAQRKTVV